jgi:energy-coupling factor transport system ATP-binding protein
MKDGGIDMDGPIREIFTNVERLEDIGLSAPQVTYLMKRLKKSIPDIRTDIFTVSQAKTELLKHLRKKQNTTKQNRGKYND